MLWFNRGHGSNVTFLRFWYNPGHVSLRIIFWRKQKIETNSVLSPDLGTRGGK
jgi:hypothetical protein